MGRGQNALDRRRRLMVQQAYSLMRQGRLVEAERSVRRILRKDPSIPAAHVILARILTELLQPDEAEVHWRLAEELEPDSHLIALEKGLALTAVGDFAQALVEIERSIDRQPIQGSAYQAFAFTKKVTEADLPMVRRMEAAVSAESLTDQDRCALRFALGKSYDNLGDFEKAIGHFDEANAIRWRLIGSPKLTATTLAGSIETKIKLYTKNAMAEAGRMGLSSPLPVAVLGMMRSGTTFVEQMLTCHPEIGGAGEQPYWADHDGLVADYTRGTIDRVKLRTCGSEYVQLLSSLAPGFPRVVDKNPANVLVAGSLHLALPNARIIHVRRHPVDTALSIWMTPMGSSADFVGNRSNIVLAIREFRRLADHWRSVIPADRYLEIQYEELVADPETNGRRMVEFIGLEWDEACLHPERNQRRVVTPSLWQVRQPIYRSSTERWKRYEPWLGEFAELLG